MPTIDVNGTVLYYERTGQGPSVLFVHGLCGDADGFADQAGRLSDRYTCVRYDRRGHARSGRGDAPITRSLHADDAAALVEALDLAPCLLVGSSGGASIAVEVALRHGHLLRGVALSEPPLFSLDPEAGQAAMGEIGPRVEQALSAGGPAAAIDAFLSHVCPGLWSILDEEGKDRYRANAEIGLTDLRAPSVDITAEDLAGLTLPALVVTGERSHPSHLSVAHRLVAAWPEARLVELEQSGHVTYAERPDDFARALAAFAAGLGTDARGGTTGRFDVASADGTSLAVWVEGDGPALVMVHGSIADHTTFDPFVEVLAEDLTTYRMDRRGFGASGDGAAYSIERDFEDVAAVVDAVAARTGGPVALWGHSYGASCAMGGAALTDGVHHLVLYEPSLGLAYPPGSIERIEAALAVGDRDAAVVEVLAGILEMTHDEIEAMRASPLWPVRLAAAHTVPRECRAEEGWVYEPGRFDGVTAPTLFLAGSESVPEVVKATAAAAAAIPHAEVRVLDGHGHLAHKTDPALVAAIVREFLAS